MYVSICGIADTNSSALEGHPYLYKKRLEENEMLLFILYSEFNIKKGQKFDVALHKNYPLQQFEFLSCALDYITDSSFLEYQEIDVGYKSLCIFSFNSAIPSILKNIPVIESWIKGNPVIWMSTKIFWEEYCFSI